MKISNRRTSTGLETKPSKAQCLWSGSNGTGHSTDFQQFFLQRDPSYQILT